MQTTMFIPKRKETGKGAVHLGGEGRRGGKKGEEGKGKGKEAKEGRGLTAAKKGVGSGQGGKEASRE